MTHEPHFFADDAVIRTVGEGLLARTLPRERWTHEAHLASCLWLLRERPDIVPERDLPAIIAGYNEAVGGTNSDSEGYHETITQLYIRAVRAFLNEHDDGRPLAALANALIASDVGDRNFPLRHYSRERLSSVAARRGWVAPDLDGRFASSHPAGAVLADTLG